MPHTSPTVELVWTVLSATLLMFLVSHLYHFDRFKCLRFWEFGRQNNGAFKKIMTFSYLLAVPLIFTRSFVMMYIKYKMGWGFIPGRGIIPTPWMLWPESLQKLIFPAHLCFAIAWSLEIVSHLEELCFWLFLTRIAPLHMAWFSSWNCRVWAVGSVASVVTMPLVAIFTRADPLKNEVYIVLVGSIGSTIVTFAFFWVIFFFPSFMRRVKHDGAGQEVVTRLQTVHSLNLIRMAFRIMFVVSFLVLAVDGVYGNRHPINNSPLWTDLLSITGGIGCLVSSCITLLIFFPRNISREAGYSSRIQSRSGRNSVQEKPQERSFFRSPVVDENNPFETTSQSHIIVPTNALWEVQEDRAVEEVERHHVPLEFRYPPPPTVPQKKRRKPVTSTVHPLVMNYSSPIDVVDAPRGIEFV